MRQYYLISRHVLAIRNIIFPDKIAPHQNDDSPIPIRYRPSINIGPY